jgi:uroporphyrinogen-III synthase
MSRPIVVLRPEPGNATTVARIAALGLEPRGVPLFDIRPVSWSVPDPGDHDALLITSANAIRMGGEQLERLRDLPVFAVGSATAEIARAAGFTIVSVGDDGAQALTAAAGQRGIRRALHIGGRDRVLAVGGPISQVITVYRSDPRELDRSSLTAIEGAVALLHSSRAAGRFRELAMQSGFDAATIRIGALSSAIAEAAGAGWGGIAVAPVPTDDALLDVARLLAD